MVSMTKLQTSLANLSKNRHLSVVVYGFFIIFLLLPLTTPLSTWIGSNIGFEDVLKSVKEIILAIIWLILIAILASDKKLLNTLVSRRVNKLIIAYSLLTVIIAIWQRPSLDAAVAGVLFNLRFLWFFILAQVVQIKFRYKDIVNILVPILLTIFGIVFVFGALQVLVLPDDILTHLGYSDSTVKPFLTIDSNDSLVRINSTLRGPNPLGAFSMLAIVFSAALWMKSYYRKVIAWLSVPALITLYGTQSRSAWLGTAISLSVFAVLYLWQRERWRKKIVVFFAVVLSTLLLAFVLLKDTQFYQIHILHNDVTIQTKNTSNSERLNSYEEAIEDIRKNPWGDGPGTSGPASRYEKGRFAENYYLQIGQEVGVVGLAVFLMIIFYTAKDLWLGRSSAFKLSLFASLMGFLAINMFLHGWADDASSYLWWGLAGFWIFGKY
jgi:hypothetical protein